MIKALKAAFPKTIPILTGFLFLGTAYGIYARTQGLPAVTPIITAAVVFAGSMEFVAVDLMTAAFDPLGAFVMAVMVNARHLFYGLSMLGKYKGKFKPYLIFGMCDESFSINCTAEVPPDVDSGKFYFWVTLLNQLYWVTGATIGSIAGSFIGVELPGLDFVMTALLVVIFLDNWLKEKNHISSIVGIVAAVACLLIFGSDSFIIPSMALIVLALTIFRRKIEGDAGKAGDRE